MNLIRRTFVYLHKENFLLLYKALVRPHLEYAHAVWSPCILEETHPSSRKCAKKGHKIGA